MKKHDDLFLPLTAHLDALIADQERLLEVIRKQKIGLVLVDGSVQANRRSDGQRR